MHLKIIDDNKATLIYPQKIKAVTPGQEAVFYLNGEMIGGGVIDKTFINGDDVSEYLDNIVLRKFHG